MTSAEGVKNEGPLNVAAALYHRATGLSTQRCGFTAPDEHLPGCPQDGWRTPAGFSTSSTASSATAISNTLALDIAWQTASPILPR